MPDRYISTYYTSISSLKRRMEKNYRTYGFKGPFEKKDFEEWRESSRKKLSSLLGLEIIERDSGDLSFNERR